MRLRNSLLLAALSVSTVPALAVDDSMARQEQMDRDGAASQERIDQMDDQAKSDFQKFRTASRRLESLKIYNQQMDKLIQSQNTEMQSIRNQIETIDDIETGALPLMLEMTETLSEVVASDVPFLQSEREERVANLSELIDRADVSAGEKYRRILEAYQVEVEYGRTIEAYRGDLVMDGEARKVEFLRIGRVGLYYQTIDGNRVGRWNSERDSWEALDAGYRTAIRDGLRVARKQAPPELLTLPINAPEQ
ncbi:MULTISPECIES: DUF3450 domain-containing protein [unclassified Marinimicrobium]|jgi:hypothetical protein|uniref:DUF3450 domain-containing protein n=1 Tax=unclassified Marinimicrobium TaxID=2632100 RepID=UPI000C63291A|nr:MULTISPECIES: DUF3450 domain-containing protein [unclassified Marinimicrobium]MAN52913.1 hypothetical protein [Marinimicrobium sp.]